MKFQFMKFQFFKIGTKLESIKYDKLYKKNSIPIKNWNLFYSNSIPIKSKLIPIYFIPIFFQL